MQWNIPSKRKEKIIRIGFILLIGFIIFFLYKINLDVSRPIPLEPSTGAIDITKENIAIRALNNFFEINSEEDLNHIISATSFFVSFAFAALVVIISLLKETYIIEIYSRIKSLIPFKTYPVQRDGVDDIAAMLKYYRKANKVTVFSGDFSWIRAPGEMSELVMKLIEGGRIKIVSYKTNMQIRSALGDDLYFRMLPYLTTHAGPEFKASLVEMQGGSQYFLYKRSRSDEKSEVICFENRDILVEPLNRFQQFSDVIPRTPIVIFICGESGSGKSAIAARLSGILDAQIVSVGGIFRKLASLSAANQDRNGVIGVGVKYLEIFGEDSLAYEIDHRIDLKRKFVIVDGLRPVGTLQQLKRKYQNSIVIYVDAPTHVRRGRIKDIDLNNLDGRIDNMVRPLKGAGSDIVVENDNNDEGDLIKTIEGTILRKFHL